MLQLLLTVGLGKRSAKGGAEESALLHRIQEADPLAATQFLEDIVLNRKNVVRRVTYIPESSLKALRQNPDWHNQLASVYIDQLLACLADESASKLWRAKGLSSHDICVVAAIHDALQLLHTLQAKLISRSSLTSRRQRRTRTRSGRGYELLCSSRALNYTTQNQ